MLQGTVKWFNDKKGYGFIDCENQQYFLHFKEILASGYKTLKEGDQVTFEGIITSKGPLAKAVSKLGESYSHNK